ncbi:MAG: hypothetical protein IJA35_00230 [Clostridia bacterium]|nr:hypothetical protein [Clostridia bacterium]
MKKFLALALVLITLMTIFAFTACGNANQRALIGTWQIVDEETATEYGIGLEFTSDGKLRYGLTEDVLAGISGEEDAGNEFSDVMEGLDALMSIDYKVISDTEMEITVSAMFGLAKETTTVSYSLEGDTLTFDGAVYTRVK